MDFDDRENLAHVSSPVIKETFSVLKPSPIRFSPIQLRRVAAPSIIIPKVRIPTIQPEEGKRLLAMASPRPTAGRGLAGQGPSHRQEGKHVRVVVVQPKFAPVPKIKIWNAGQAQGCRFAPIPQFGQAPAVVQAKTAYSQPRFYPNLNPAAAAVKADPTEFLRLERGFDEVSYRMRRGGDHGLLVPNTKFIFVRTMDGDMVMHQRYRHPVLAQGKPVLYAGEAYFNNGKLDWWSNGSGNYRPDSDHAEQAALPMGRFFTYEQVLKGANKEPRQQRKISE